MDSNQLVWTRILELCSESQHGSWEFWSDVNQKKIYAVEYGSIADQSYKEASLDRVRLKTELERARESQVDPKNSIGLLLQMKEKRGSSATQSY